MYNVYHPLDPVAYKLEPLAYPPEALAGRKAALIELAGGGKRLHIAAEEFGDALVDNVSRFGSSIAGYFSSASGKKQARPDAVAGGASTSGVNTGEAADFDDDGNGQSDKHRETCDATVNKETDMDNVSRTVDPSNASNISRIVGRLPPGMLGRPTTADGRLDFSLQEAYVQHEYVQALGSHFSYWASADVGKFCYRVIAGLDPISGEEKKEKTG